MQINAVPLIFGLWALPLAAQETPLSAIDWLAVQRTVEPVVTVQPETPEKPVAQSATVPKIDVQPLDTPSIGGVGLLPSAVTGLPVALWQGSAEADLIAALERLHRRKPSVPALDSLFHTLLLAEATPPAGSRGEDLLRARLRSLYTHGLVAPAEALAERIGTLTPALFQQAFDLALLTGSDEALCQVLNDQPTLSNDLPTRIWCATRSGDFPRAMTIYQTATALGQLSDLDAELLLRFLDPEYAEDIQPLRPPVRPTPLQFRLFEAIGEALPTTPLPLPFAVVELSGDSGWRAQLQAAERLARAGAIDGNQLLGVYTEQLRAASGGIWDRVDALQRFETALNTRDPGAVSSSLERVWPQMRTAGLLVPFSNLFAARLQGLPLSDRAERISGFAGLLSKDYERFAPALLGSDVPELVFLAKIAQGDATGAPRSTVPHAQALAQAWSTAPTAPDDLAQMAQENRLGEALLTTLLRFETGAEGRPADLTQALQTLRAFGLEDTARRAALQLAILDMEGARR
ncbi:hypothetical protein MWU54_13905 [Marivita sp. S6314]|uniref:hypothetical protein n=1 Tax=Marivita sp. S6314 TaxID=2926406 RepID=UPI001FF3CE8F|nr:hypothetical protein [Marivita sp. S6314]MCK0151129.1 hypothetical protein [Marivita sp. S6314]